LIATNLRDHTFNYLINNVREGLQINKCIIKTLKQYLKLIQKINVFNNKKPPCRNILIFDTAEYAQCVNSGGPFYRDPDGYNWFANDYWSTYEVTLTSSRDIDGATPGEQPIFRTNRGAIGSHRMRVLLVITSGTLENIGRDGYFILRLLFADWHDEFLFIKRVSWDGTQTITDMLSYIFFNNGYVYPTIFVCIYV